MEVDSSCSDVIEEDDYIYEDHLLPASILPYINDPFYDSDSLGSRPLRKKWPKDTLLPRDHFTIDEQQCMNCEKKLGYAMPMNKRPNKRFLFCSEECFDFTHIRCVDCGNFTFIDSGYLVNHPGNSGFDGPSDIFRFQCKSCYQDMVAAAPTAEECAKQMKELRKLREKDELAHKFGPATADLYNSSFAKPAGKKRKQNFD